MNKNNYSKVRFLRLLFLNHPEKPVILTLGILICVHNARREEKSSRSYVFFYINNFTSHSLCKIGSIPRRETSMSSKKVNDPSILKGKERERERSRRKGTTKYRRRLIQLHSERKFNVDLTRLFFEWTSLAFDFFPSITNQHIPSPMNGERDKSAGGKSELARKTWLPTFDLDSTTLLLVLRGLDNLYPFRS